MSKKTQVYVCENGYCGPKDLTDAEVVAALKAKGLDVAVLVQAYDWTYGVNGEIAGLIAGDQCYEPTGIVVPHIKELHEELQKAKADLDGLRCIHSTQPAPEGGRE
jgi:hypothetical protein